jgi:26S proteasome regulatory subunit N7
MTVSTSAQLLGAGQDEGDATVQDLKVLLAQHKFSLQRADLPNAEKKKLLGEVESIITEHSLSGVYEHFCSQLGWTADEGALAKMKEANEAKMKELEDKIAGCEKNDGDEEVRDAMLDRADHLCNIGDKAAAWKAYDAVEKKSPSPNTKLTIAFCKVRLELLLGNWSEIKQLLDDAKIVCEKGGDWEKKNRLMVRCLPALGAAQGDACAFRRY